MKKKNSTFKAAVLFNLKKPLKIININYPDKLKKGQIFIHLKSSSICGAQANEINGIKGPDKYLPHMMGHEGYGKVINVGKSVKKVKKGDNVILHWRKGYGIEADAGLYYSKKFGKINSGKVTTFSEYTTVSENRVTKIKISSKLKKIAPCFGCSLSTSYGLVFKEAKMKINNRLLIIGSGGLGLSIAAMARSKGIKNIMFVDKNFNNYKTKFIKSLRLNNIKNYMHKKIEDCKGNKFNHIIDTTGDIKILEKAFNIMTGNSKLILVGQPKKNKTLKLKNALSMFDGKTIFASDGGLINPSKDLQKISDYVNKNFQYFKNFISHDIFLKDVNKGFTKLKHGNALRISLKF
ncbi:alcohol dehydrogenase catalytic domain-containing protein [Pelagibacterales bacterium SAG-MED02]|nr:alcohol dehydrogenase catalytic domain-containing protein [Pelagibacterales bacterium SAG-MED02]